MTKSNILFIIPQCPIPATDGGKIGLLAPLKFMTKYQKVFVTSPIEKIDENIINQFNDLGISYFPYQLNKNDDYKKYPLSLIKKWSFKYDKYFSNDYLKYI